MSSESTKNKNNWHYSLNKTPFQWHASSTPACVITWFGGKLWKDLVEYGYQRSSHLMTFSRHPPPSGQWYFSRAWCQVLGSRPHMDRMDDWPRDLSLAHSCTSGIIRMEPSSKECWQRWADLQIMLSITTSACLMLRCSWTAMKEGCRIQCLGMMCFFRAWQDPAWTLVRVTWM